MKKTITLLAVVLFTTTIFAQLPSYVPTSGLAAWYSFTGNANDDSGMGNNGTINGATLTSGKLGIPNTAYSFDGVSNSIGLVNPFLGGSQANAFTFHALIKLNSTTNAPNIWGKTLSWGEVNFYISNINEIGFRWANSITGNKYSSIISQTNAVQNSLWYDVVVVFQNSTGQIYLNGNAVTTNLNWTAQGGGLISTTQIEASCNFAEDANSSIIGLRTSGGSPGNYLNGIIDEFGIWNRALTQAEITALYNGSNCNISITAQPANQNITIGANAEFTLATSGTSATYQWQTDIGMGWVNLTNAGQYNGVTNDTLTVASTTMSNNNQLFRVIVHDGSCVDSTNAAVLNITTSISENNNLKEITLYPNPATDKVFIESNSDINKIKIMNVLGQEVKTLQTNSKRISISTTDLPDNIYFIKINDSNVPLKLLKTH